VAILREPRARITALTASRSTERLLAVVLVLLLAAIGIVVLTSGGGSTSSAGTPSAARSGSPNALEGPEIANGKLRAANFSLLDQNGHRVSLSSFRGQVVILTFMHSLCHGACPLMAEQIKGALNSLPNGGRGIPAIAISVDPAQDTRANRAKFLAKYQMTGRLDYLSGPRGALRKVWRAYAVQPLIGNGSNDNHSAFVFLIDKRGLWREGWPVGQLTPEGLSHDIGVLERERA
jgi:protein SCO1/2